MSCLCSGGGGGGVGATLPPVELPGLALHMPRPLTPLAPPSASPHPSTPSTHIEAHVEQGPDAAQL